MIVQTGSLRFSVYGGLLFGAGLISLLLIPVYFGIAAMCVGGLMVWGGFISTLLKYYGPNAEQPPAADPPAPRTPATPKS